jgi:hypothetical protein
MLVAGIAAGAAVLAAGGIGWAATRQADAGTQRPRAQVETLAERSASRVVEAGPSVTRTAVSPTESANTSVGRSANSSPAASAVTSARPRRRLDGTARWLAALERLDAVRARAFAARDAAALRTVYASPELVRTDVALLDRLVPRGCGLHGVRTSFRPRTVSAAPGRVTLVVTATLGASQLVCGGQVRASVPGAGPTRLRVVLVIGGGGPRIVRQEVAG